MEDDAEYSSYVPSGMSESDARRLQLPDVMDIVQEFMSDLQEEGEEGLRLDGSSTAIVQDAVAHDSATGKREQDF
jgi:hypothetical protein